MRKCIERTAQCHEEKVERTEALGERLFRVQHELVSLRARLDFDAEQRRADSVECVVAADAGLEESNSAYE